MAKSFRIAFCLVFILACLTLVSFAGGKKEDNKGKKEENKILVPDWKKQKVKEGKKKRLITEKEHEILQTEYYVSKFLDINGDGVKEMILYEAMPDSFEVSFSGARKYSKRALEDFYKKNNELFLGFLARERDRALGRCFGAEEISSKDSGKKLSIVKDPSLDFKGDVYCGIYPFSSYWRRPFVSLDGLNSKIIFVRDSTSCYKAIRSVLLFIDSDGKVDALFFGRNISKNNMWDFLFLRDINGSGKDCLLALDGEVMYDEVKHRRYKAKE